MSANLRYVHSLRCPCGLEISGATEEDLVALARRHLAVAHPQLADRYSAVDILALAYPRPAP